MREHLISVSESSLLRTPAASEAERGHQPEDKARARGGQVTLSGQFMHLPTPNTMDHLPPRDESKIDRSKGGFANVRETVVREMLPTLRASDSYERRNKKTMQKIADEGGDMTMPTLARTQTNWGKFEPAIKRWEAVLGRPAPEPTKPDGKENAHRLSSRFTEWMMGVPEGWITDVGLSRNDELKACGNGVVPQQAELAVKILLEGVSFDSERGGGQTVLPTPTVMDQREGKSFRSVAVKNLQEGFNRGLNLNNVTEAGLLDWNEGDKFEIVDGKVQKIDQSDTE